MYRDLYTIYHKESDTCRILFYCIQAIIIGILCNFYRYVSCNVIEVVFLTIWRLHVSNFSSPPVHLSFTYLEVKSRTYHPESSKITYSSPCWPTARRAVQNSVYGTRRLLLPRIEGALCSLWSGNKQSYRTHADPS